MFEPHQPFYVAENTEQSRSLVDQVRSWSRAENRAAANRLGAIAELWSLRLRECGERADWVADAHAAVTAEVAAALCVSQGLAGSFLNHARAMRERLPLVATVFMAGDLDYRLFQTIVYRTDLICDAEVLAAVDRELAVKAPRWPSMTPGRLAGYIDKVVARADADAVRHRRDRQSGREVWIGFGDGGMAEIHGSLWTSDAHALDKRLNALAATVCEHDPRTKEQRRADSLGAMAAGAERLGCRCGRPDCAAGGETASAVVIHVIAEQATVAGSANTPGSMVGVDALIPPELISELAQSAKLVPLVHPGDAPPQCGYLPSRELADFVRCRDLTCRFPGCDRPSTSCDLDHTIPYSEGGPTHASNLKCVCRLHHLLKTFWGWRDQQLPDGTVIWTSPAGDTYVTTPGSALLFPSLSRPTGSLPEPVAPVDDRCADRSAMMPQRQRTRAQQRAQRVTAERRQNQRDREARRNRRVDAYFGNVPNSGDDDDGPPPF